MESVYVPVPEGSDALLTLIPFLSNRVGQGHVKEGLDISLNSLKEPMGCQPYKGL
jgi:hypothetical protein